MVTLVYKPSEKAQAHMQAIFNSSQTKVPTKNAARVGVTEGPSGLPLQGTGLTKRRPHCYTQPTLRPTGAPRQ